MGALPQLPTCARRPGLQPLKPRKGRGWTLRYLGASLLLPSVRVPSRPHQGCIAVHSTPNPHATGLSAGLQISSSHMLEPTLGAQKGRAEASMCRDRNRAQKGKGAVLGTQQAGGRASPTARLSLPRLLSARAPRVGHSQGPARGKHSVGGVGDGTVSFSKPTPASGPSHLSLPPSPSIPRAHLFSQGSQSLLTICSQSQLIREAHPPPALQNSPLAWFSSLNPPRYYVL